MILGSHLIKVEKHKEEEKANEEEVEPATEDANITNDEDINSIRKLLFDNKYDKVENYLYFGDITTASDTILHELLGIKRVLTLYHQPMRTELFSEEVSKLGIQCKFIKLEQKESDDLLSYLPECIKFITDGQSSEQNVFVHCAAGVSRSAAVIIALIMYKYNYTFRDAWDVVKAIRRSIVPSDTFIEQLNIFERLGRTIDANNKEFRLFLFMSFVKFLRPKKANDYAAIKSSNEFIETLDHYFNRVEMAQNNSVTPLDCGQQYVCGKCNYKLFNAINVIKTDKTDIELENNACDYLFIEPQIWMTQLVEKKPILAPIGVIICVECDEIIGDYNLSMRGFACECPLHRPFSSSSARTGDYTKKLETNYKCLVFRIMSSKVKD